MAEVVNKRTRTTEARGGTKPSRFIYLGAYLPQLRMKSGTVFKGGIPEEVQDIFKTCPAARKLTVPIDRTAETMRQIDVVGSDIRRLFEETKKFGEEVKE